MNTVKFNFICCWHIWQMLVCFNKDLQILQTIQLIIFFKDIVRPIGGSSRNLDFFGLYFPFYGKPMLWVISSYSKISFCIHDHVIGRIASPRKKWTINQRSSTPTCIKVHHWLITYIRAPWHTCCNSKYVIISMRSRSLYPGNKPSIYRSTIHYC
ncbi:hypothetical protein D3C73_1259670 [compost metagenome]